MALLVVGGDGHHYALPHGATESITRLLFIHIKVPLGEESDIAGGQGERGHREARGLVMCVQEHILGKQLQVGPHEGWCFKLRRHVLLSIQTLLQKTINSKINY